MTRCQPGIAVDLSVVCPAYNEQSRLPATLRASREYLDSAGLSYEFVVVDDGSTDATGRIVEAEARHWPQLRLLRMAGNSGKGAAVRAGMLAATGRLRLFTDADMSTPIREFASLRSRINGTCTVAVASRALPGSVIGVHQTRRRERMGRIYNGLVRLLVLRGLRDTQCGFKLFTAEAAVACFAPLVTTGFGADVEVLLRARRLGWTVAEVPTRWDHRDDSRVSAGRDSLRMLADLVLLRIRLRHSPSPQTGTGVARSTPSVGRHREYVDGRSDSAAVDRRMPERALAPSGNVIPAEAVS